MNSKKNIVGIIFLICGLTAGLQGMDSSSSGKPATPKKLWIDFMREKPYFRGRDECDLAKFIGQALGTEHVTKSGFENFVRNLQALVNERPIDPMAEFSPILTKNDAATVLLPKTSLDDCLQKICQRAGFMRDNEVKDRLQEILKVLKIDEKEFSHRTNALPIPPARSPEEYLYMCVDQYLPQGPNDDINDFLVWLTEQLEKLDALDIDKKVIVRKTGTISLREYFDRSMQYFEELQKDPSSTEEDKEHATLARKQYPLVRDLIYNFKKAGSGELDKSAGKSKTDTSKDKVSGTNSFLKKGTSGSKDGLTGKEDTKTQTTFTDTDSKKKSWWKSLLSNKLVIATGVTTVLAVVGGLAWTKWGRKGKTAAPAK